MNTESAEDTAPSFTHTAIKRRHQIVGVMVRVSVPEEITPEQVVKDIRASVEFGNAELSLAYVIAPLQNQQPSYGAQADVPD